MYLPTTKKTPSVATTNTYSTTLARENLSYEAVQSWFRRVALCGDFSAKAVGNYFLLGARGSLSLGKKHRHFTRGRFLILLVKAACKSGVLLLLFSSFYIYIYTSLVSEFFSSSSAKLWNSLLHNQVSRFFGGVPQTSERQNRPVLFNNDLAPCVFFFFFLKH